MRLIDQVFQANLQMLFGPTATIEDVKVTDGTVEFTLPISQKQQFPHGVALEITGIYDGKLDCSMTEAELTTQLHFVHALVAASSTVVIRFNTVRQAGQLDPTPPAFCDTRLPQLIAADSIQRQAKQEQDNWSARNLAKTNKEV